MVIAGLFAFLTQWMSAPAYGYEYQADGLIVKYKTSVTPTQAQVVNSKHKVMTETTINRINAQSVTVNDLMPVELKVQELKSDPAVEYVEPNYQRSISITSPNDSYYNSYQWNLPKIKADYVWDIQKGGSNVVIAIIDTGVSLSHPDLAGKLVAGYDAVAHDGDPSDENGHGTHVAGIAAAITNNGVGVAGVSWNSRIMPVRVMDAAGNGWDSDIAEGIIWAADNGADVINLSLGGASSSPQTLQIAVNYANARGVTVVAAAGNIPNGAITYPAACANVIGVAATDSNDNRASFSNYGYFVDVAAPGVSIRSTFWNTDPTQWPIGNAYADGSGTSMASPHVAGLAALLLSEYPSSTTAQIERAIEATAVDLGTPGRDNYYGYGRIDAMAAINYGGAKSNLTTPANGYIQQTVGPLLFDWADLYGATGYAIELCSQNPTDNPNGNTASVYRLAAAVCPGSASQFPGDTTGLPPGTYWWRIIAIKDGQLYGGFSDAKKFNVPLPVAISWPFIGTIQKTFG